MQTYTAALVGTTGLVGSHILSSLTSDAIIHRIYAFSRQHFPSNHKVEAIIKSDSSTWTTTLQDLRPSPDIFYSALGTSRRQAGSFEAQRAIDLDLNLALAKRAFRSGARVYVLISTAMANSDSRLGYSQMRGDLDREVGRIGFDHVVILRPGFLLGRRRDAAVVQAVAQGFVKRLRALTESVDSFAQDADVVARAAVVAGDMCLREEKSKGVWIVGQAEIIKLAKVHALE